MLFFNKVSRKPKSQSPAPAEVKKTAVMRSKQDWLPDSVMNNSRGKGRVETEGAGKEEEGEGSPGRRGIACVDPKRGGLIYLSFLWL